MADQAAAVFPEQPEAKRIKLENTNNNNNSNDTDSKTRLQHPPKSKTTEKVEYIKEADVGVLEYVNPTNTRFSAIIKHRYSDFIVNEIDPSGTVIHLQSAGKIEDPHLIEVFEKDDEDLNLTEDQKMEKAINQLESIVGSTEAKRIETLTKADSNTPEKQITLECDLTKPQRTEIYAIFKRYLKDIMDCETINGKLQFTHVSFGATGGQKSRRDPRRKRKDWEHGGDFLHFTVYKENKDTMEVLNKLAKVLRMKTGAFGFAGTKDKRGVTTQRCSVFKLEATKLQSAVQKLGNLRMESATRLGDYRYEKERIKLGDLLGNRFTIVLRYVSESTSQEDIEKSLKGLQNDGFINYYGMQRFGTSTVASHEIGIQVLKANWQAVVDLILDPREGEKEDILAAGKKWVETKDPIETLKLFPKYGALAEKAVINFFIEDKKITNCCSAFGRIPRTMRLMYAHAYQSLIWNWAATERVRRYGVSGVVPGDLVAIDSSKQPNFSNGEENDGEEVENDDEADTLGTGKHKFEVEVVTPETVSKYTIMDVVLPLPGWSIKLPENDIGKVYAEKMALDGISMNTFKNHSTKEYRLTGSYRKLLAKPEDLEWEWMRFNDGTLPLVQTDYAKLKNLPLPESVPDGKHLALRLSFNLESSTYATMLLREILSSETGSAHQAALSTNIQ
ncbi:multisubstrate pseudouridine synthase 7 [Mycoemilia scoparia]|uniref:Multisubstrate pseudouridine synthase 7 n=1 Tax=Mycoemilia scoparia TaxID=417184 RepID=A0A9W7ZMR3_9FUNG|nr:multisubstrate pseudouridine synthase 7 [Mycoemilia scoparia]